VDNEFTLLETEHDSIKGETEKGSGDLHTINAKTTYCNSILDP
jgi:hypothetical protein